IRKNITTVKKLYFASNLDFNRDVDCGTSYTECEQAAIAEWTTHGGIPRDTQIKGLQSALNPAKWVDAEKNHYLKLIPKAQKAGFQMLPMAKVKFKVEEVVHAASNPFKDAPGVIVYQMKSAPIYKYLKHMNVNSMNWTADKIFEGLGGAEEWKTFATKVLKLDPSTFEINNGSGLNIGADYPNRKDNFSTCNNMIAGLAIMDKALVQQGGKYTLEDIMMVSGIDEGTLSGVYAGEYLSRSVVAKTGTLKNAATLAGFVRTQKGIVFFGLFFQTLSISQARNARDILVQRLIKEYGGPAKTNWKSAGPFLSFDAQSVLTEVGTAQHSTNLN
ncbi:MAG: D-alanyl-D-alanine carboxypeptidase, partial [Pseudobdellovibrionaceae bacterium]